MILLLRWMGWSEYRKEFPSWKFLVYQIISAFFLVWVCFMTAKALNVRNEDGLEWYGFDYFHFLITGEAALLLPQAAMAAAPRMMRTLLSTTLVFEFLRESYWQSIRKFTALCSGALSTGFIHLLLFVAAAVFFQTEIDAGEFLLALFYCIVNLPIFLIMGFGFSTVVLITGRGQGVIAQVLLLLQVLAGVYFPVEVFGGWAKYFSLVLPHAFVLDGIRVILSGRSTAMLWISAIQYQACFIAVILPLVLGAYYWARKRVRSRSVPDLVIY